MNSLLDAGPKAVAFATEWFLSNPNLPKGEQATSLMRQPNQAQDPIAAARIAVETAYDLRVAESAPSRD